MFTISENELINRYRAYCKKAEGDIPHFYLDSDGNPTLGRGHLVVKNSTQELENLATYLSSSTKTVTSEEVENDINTTKKAANGNPTKYLARFYKKFTKLRIAPEDIEKLWEKDVLQKIIEIRNPIKEKIYAESHNGKKLTFRELPPSLQLLLIDIAFNSGVGHLFEQTKHNIDKCFFNPLMKSIYRLNWRYIQINISNLHHHLQHPGEDKYGNPRPSLIGNDRIKIRNQWLKSAEQEYNAILAFGGDVFLAINNLQPLEIPKSLINKSELNFLQKNPKTNSLFKSLLPTGIHWENLRAFLPQLTYESISTHPNNIDRPYLELITPLADEFLVKSFSGEEGLSTIFCYHIIAYSKNQHIKPNALIKKSVTLKINNSNIQKPQYFHGEVYAYSLGEIQNNYRQYTLEIRPHIWFLNHSSNCRIFQNKTTADIIKILCNEFHIPLDLSRLHHALKKRTYCVQYHETTLNFIQRLLEEEGIFYYFRHEKNRHIFVLADNAAIYKTCAIEPPPTISNIQNTYQLHINQSTHHEYIYAHSQSPELKPAYKFHSEKTDYAVTHIQHFAKEHHYFNQLTCIPASKTYHPERTTVKPEIHGIQTATVIGDAQQEQIIAVDCHGSILVRFHWDREKNSATRIRVAQNMAGKNWGMSFHPRIGQEVVVIFEDGDPDRPLVIGSVYNFDQMPPYPLSMHHTQSGIKTKSINSHGHNEIRFEDKSNAEEFYLHAQKDMTEEVENNQIIKLTQGDYVTSIQKGKNLLEAEIAIEFKVGNNSIEINQNGILIKGKTVNIN